MGIVTGRFGGLPLPAMSDGVVTVRAPAAGDSAVLISGRDEEFHRWMGMGTEEPDPTGCVVVDGVVVGWVDFDLDHDWLEPGEVNVGYNVFAPYRGQGYAPRAVQLLGHHLAMRTPHRGMSLLIDTENKRSLALAERLGFTPAPSRRGQPPGQQFFTRPVAALTYTDNVVSIRSLTVDDLDADLEAKDDEQIDWLWLPGQREHWEAMTVDEQRAHALSGLRQAQESFGHGPKWRFAGDVLGSRYAVYADCDLANDRVPRGQANISYSAHPRHRGHGYVSRAVRLVLRFLADNTGAQEAHIIIDPLNTASLRVARSVGAVQTDGFLDEYGTQMIRHVLPISRHR
ncbi:MAG: GNAT family N-acetyltransferase [Acidimicrobiales bacterium]